MPTLESLPTDVRDEVVEVSAEAAEELGVAIDAEPYDIVSAIEERIVADRTASDDEVVALGALLGEQYVRGLGWAWGVVDYGDDRVYSVVSPDGRIANHPMRWVHDVVLDPEREIAFRLNYNLVLAGEAEVPDDAERPATFH